MSNTKEWPRLQKDWHGLRVRVVHPIKNNRGDRAEVGRLATIFSVYNGKLKLEVEMCDKCMSTMFVTGVSPSSVELV